MITWWPKQSHVTAIPERGSNTMEKFTVVYPCVIRRKLGDTLSKFANNVGIPDQVRSELDPELTGKNTEFQAQAKRLGIDVTHSEAERSNQNHAAEQEIGELKKRYKQKMIKKGAPKRVWDYGFVHQAGVLSRLARGRNGQTGIKEVTGNTPDISEWLYFDLYDRVWWLDTKKPATTDDNVTLGRWLGISHKIGSDMCYWLLTVSGNFIARTTVQHMTRDEYLDLVMCERIKEFDEQILNE